MSDARSRAEQTARIIVEHGAFYIRTAGDPFFFTSGWASPLFIDCKKLISFPDARNALIELSLDFIAGEIGLENIDSVAGCELAGVPFAAMIADRIERPLVIGRKQGKGFGRLAQFEGHFDPGSKVLLVDDLATDGISKLAFRAALERAEAGNDKLQKSLKNVQDVINLWESRIIGNLKAMSTLAAYLSPDEKDKN